MKSKDGIALFLSIALTELAGVLGSIFTVNAIPVWYATLQKPALNPPAVVFGPVWTVLYLLMGLALFLVWRKGLYKKGTGLALTVFGIQLILNVLWSIVFFGLHSIAWALVVIILLWLCIFLTLILFAKISKGTMWLLVPYLLWVSFALYLNYSLFILNH